MTATETDFSFTDDERSHMRAALSLAARGLGNVAPNPAVGCILVRPDLGNGRVVGRGWTQPGGRPHAETEALRRAGTLSRGAHAYVTLEPCTHSGKTEPCAEALIEAGVSTVTIAIGDPDPRVSGSGIKKLQEAGISVRTGLLAAEAQTLNCGFLSRIGRGSPWVTMKTATTLDGAIAARNGESQWITGPAARARGHLLRAENDVLLTGIGTVRADNPEMTCRLSGFSGKSPIRVVIDPRGETPIDGKLFRSIDIAPLWLIVGDDLDRAAKQKLSDAGAKIIEAKVVPGGRIDPGEALTKLAGEGITRVLLEAGSSLSGSFVSAGLVDEIAWFRAAGIMGGDGLPAIAAMAVNNPGNAPKFKLSDTIDLDGDVFERYLRVSEKDD